jgi:threonylcarbamoyladenosine tRNA methylthiotransferase MtaB
VPTFYVENFGCRATQADGAALERQFAERGLARAINPARADLVILNSCTVTSAADQDARAAIRRVRRHNPNAKIVVTGCYAQRAPEEVAALPGVTCVVGNSHKHQLADLALPVLSDFGWRSASSAALDTAKPAAPSAAEGTAFVPLGSLTAEAQGRKPEPEGRLYVSDIFAHTELLAAPVFEFANRDAAGSHQNDRTRPNLKVQDGCDNRCSFCVIPFVRGQSRSLPLDQILREVHALVATSYREVVISGINLGRWGRDLAISHQPSGVSETRTQDTSLRKPDAGSRAPRFEDLIRAILSETSLEKLRISSVEPMDWSRELIALMASSPRIAKHAHVPLQSGSDAVLRRMHRKYRPWHYRDKIEQIRAAMPTAAIGADVMVGFPGESDAEFEATRRLITDLPFTYLHVFTYSARPGTPAAALPDQVPVHTARERNRILRELAEEKKQVFMRSFLGKTIEAITLGSCGNGSCGDGRLPRPAEQGEARSSTIAAIPTRSQPRSCESEQGTSGFALAEALTDNYLKLRLKGHHAPNRWITAHIEGVEDGALVGTTPDPAEMVS